MLLSEFLWDGHVAEVTLQHGGVFRMKLKRMIKRLAAVGAGAAMLGATAMGALAVDLKDYPSFFVTDGTFDGYMVVGENAAAVDNLAMTDIAASMKYTAVAETTATTVSGDAWQVKSGSDVLEVGEHFGPQGVQGIVDFIGSGQLDALKNQKFSNSQGTFEYEQFLHFETAAINTTYIEDDDDVTDLFLRIRDNYRFARYELNFLESAESDIDTSESEKLDDYEGKAISFIGSTYNIVKATSSEDSKGKITLILMSGSTSDSILEGETKTYTIDGKEFELSLTFTNTADQAKFVVNGETTPLMDEGDTEKLSDGTILGLSEVLYQDYAGGVHQAVFYLGADKIQLEDDSINTSGSTDELKVNDETIDGAAVTITGSLLTVPTSSADGELEMDTIVVNMTSQDDYFVAAGETLGGQAELKEKDLLFTKNWDIQFEGLDGKVKTNPITLVDKSGEAEYWLTFTNVDGGVIEFPLAWASSSNLRFGNKDDVLNLNKSYIKDENYFILNDDTDEDSATHVIQYKGADKFSKSNGQAKFKILATGETLDRPVTLNNNGDVSLTLTLSGTSYTLKQSNLTGPAAAGGGDVDDWNITVSAGAAATATYTNATDAMGSHSFAASDYIITKGGARVLFGDIDLGGNASIGLVNHLNFNVSLIDNDHNDDIAGTVSTTAPYVVFSANISAASSEVDLAGVGGVGLTSPEDDDDNSYGYGANGAKVRRYSPSGGGTSADEMYIDWPDTLRGITAYVTAGSTTSSTTGGDLKAVTVVDATKLDSEVSAVDAQNLLVIGGPCVNTVSAELLGNPSVCTQGFMPGKSRVKLFTHANGKVAMLVAGYSGADTRLAGKVVSHRWSELSGTEVEVEGTTYSDATISAPSVAATTTTTTTTE